MNQNRTHQYGLSLLELLISLAIAALIMAGLAGIVNQTLNIEDVVRQRNDLTQQARFAMQRMVTAIHGTQRLLLPLADNPATNWRENVREETVPASPPEGSSIRATAVLALTLSPLQDRDGDGFMDADNDKDGLIDEDIGFDNNADHASGIAGIDDDGDGLIDESSVEDDDEDQDNVGTKDEDPINGLDDDGDGSIDEDAGADMNGDLQPGSATVDDDGDGLTDESNKEDDDEDEDNRGTKDEDWFDSMVFSLNAGKLIERQPAFSDLNGDSKIDGADFTESTIAEKVTRFRVERIPQGGYRAMLLDITLELTGASGESVRLNTRVRVGGT